MGNGIEPPPSREYREDIIVVALLWAWPEASGVNGPGALPARAAEKGAMCPGTTSLRRRRSRVGTRRVCLVTKRDAQGRL